MVSDPSGIAADLRARAEKLLQAASAIEEAYGLKSAGKQPKNGEGTRREQLVRLLNEQGPMRRSEIIAKSGIPKGTIAHLLGNDDSFSQDDVGRWIARGKEAK